MITYLKAIQSNGDLASMSSIIFCKYNDEEYQSDVLNSYGMFHPMGPNFLRSCTTECRKEITYNIGLY